MESEKTSLYKQWDERKSMMDQSLELQLFYRDCQNADNQMAKQEVCNNGIHYVFINDYTRTITFKSLNKWLVICALKENCIIL